MTKIVIALALVIVTSSSAEIPVSREELQTALDQATNSPDYKAGYTKGYPVGIQFASDGGDKPMGIAIGVMARNWQEREAPRSSEDWKGGFIAGFWKGFEDARAKKKQKS